MNRVCSIASIYQLFVIVIAITAVKALIYIFTFGQPQVLRYCPVTDQYTTVARMPLADW